MMLNNGNAYECSFEEFLRFCLSVVDVATILSPPVISIIILLGCLFDFIDF